MEQGKQDFEVIYQTYFRDVFLYIRRLSGSDDLAEEITSETFFKALEALDRFRGDCQLRVWLCQIAKNCYYTHMKKQHRTCRLEDLDTVFSAPASTDMEERLIDKNEASRIARLAHDLPEPYRSVFTLRVFQEQSFRHIGSLFGKTENWACVTYHRARAKIKKEMEES